MKKQLLTTTLAAGILFSGFHGTAGASVNTYTVKNGDSLWGISQSNHVTINQLMDWNQLSSTTLLVGQVLSLSAPSESITSKYKVKSGDTLWGIANANGISLNDLKSLNGLTSDSIYVGQTLVVKGDISAPITAANTSNLYTVKSGDSLWSIATRHNLSVSQLKSYNQLSSDLVYVNQVLHLAPSGVSNGEPSVQSTAAKVEALIIEAKRYMGISYQWGGSTPSGFDCSGYLNYVYNNVGILIPRTVATIWNATKSVSSPNIGDIVFYNTTGNGPSHAGIYLGNNQFIHAGTSLGVTITDMNVSYWKTRYLGARTPF